MQFNARGSAHQGPAPAAAFGPDAGRVVSAITDLLIRSEFSSLACLERLVYGDQLGVCVGPSRGWTGLLDGCSGGTVFQVRHAVSHARTPVSGLVAIGIVIWLVVRWRTRQAEGA